MRRNCTTLMTVLVAAAVMLVTAGCVADEPRNPSFDITTADARQVLQHLRNRPATSGRPIVVVGGYSDPGVASTLLAAELRRLVPGRRVVAVSLGFARELDDCRRRIVNAVQSAMPSADANETIAVDVVGYSMGGLAARYAGLRDAATPNYGRRLKIARLFTISSPLRGAALADFPLTINPLQRDMRPGSKLYRRLNASPASFEDLYPVYSYVRLGDIDVGAQYASVPGQTPWWVATPPAQSAHLFAFDDPRILADLALRLRNETPITTDPPAELP